MEWQRLFNTFQVLGGKRQHKHSRWACCVGTSPAQLSGLCVVIMGFWTSASKDVQKLYSKALGKRTLSLPEMNVLICACFCAWLSAPPRQWALSRREGNLSACSCLNSQYLELYLVYYRCSVNMSYLKERVSCMGCEVRWLKCDLVQVS